MIRGRRNLKCRDSKNGSSDRNDETERAMIFGGGIEKRENLKMKNRRRAPRGLTGKYYWVGGSGWRKLYYLTNVGKKK